MKNETAYKIEKAPNELLNTSRGQKRNPYPIEKMKVGEMFKAPIIHRPAIYNAIKHRRNYTKEIEGWVFTVKSIDIKTIAVIRLK